MQTEQSSPDSGVLSGKPRLIQWAVLLLLSILFSGILEFARLPAALLVGPMLAAILCGTNGATIRVFKPGFAGAQAIVGCLIAASISSDIFTALSSSWPLILGVVLATVCASSFLGWIISRWRILPGTTAVWGSAPGAATAMVLMAGAFGADARLVAFMQYLRVIIVSLAAALVARIWVDTGSVAPPQIVWFPEIEIPAFAATLFIAVAGGVVGRLLRLPSPYFLGAMIVGIVLHIGLDLPMQIPEWLLAISYALVGWSIGLNFTRPILRHASKALPQVIASILILVAFCGGLAWLLVHLLGIDPLTAYLATSPGGMDSVAIIAAASNNVDISFVMALQSARFLLVLLLGPPLARYVARRVKP
ncbi:AbrB family transcriptional regulator [Mesorhizobium sp. SB112]|uniref:AbrB family transcriptional regulator n=1 Tax=Mesorhizobium sp. SB112 TaxID=3151853 RepID=UPI0032631CE1